MCRLFGLTAGKSRVKATFWLLDAPDSLQVQSHRNADGAGLGFFGRRANPCSTSSPNRHGVPLPARNPNIDT